MREIREIELELKLLRRPGISPTDVIVYCLLRGLREEGMRRTENIRYEDIAKLLGLGERTIYRSIKRLRDWGMIEPIYEYQKPNRYIVYG